MIFKWLEILGNHKMAEVNSLKQFSKTPTKHYITDFLDFFD